ncbi:death domain-associated protein 6 isoform X1 [Danio rerio]|uniref:Death domain-associated protein 6 n=3 Tax=Danio rerio TaxID=7955 RepID=A0A8M2B6F2_DANRE|nr:death domain-associated protein 6 isoform X1 [Danio rerio]|eukprot:XP_005159495.2 death domain-associated protein 6 isoform X1 [Danio rerio]
MLSCTKIQRRVSGSERVNADFETPVWILTVLINSMLSAQQIRSPPFRMAGAGMESIVILDDDDEEAASTSASCSQATAQHLKTPVKSQPVPAPTHITQSPFASAKKDTHVLKVENEKLFNEFVEHCSKHSQEHPEVMTYLQTRYSKALPTFLTSVEFRNTLGRCLTRAQANAGKTFVYINELCTVLKQHTPRKRSSIQSLSVKAKPEEKSNGVNVKEDTQGEQDGGKDVKQQEEESKKTKRASRRQIAYLENLLKVYNEEIRRLQEGDLSLDDLEKEDSSYIQEHKLKRKMMKIYEKLCELKGCNTLTGRVIEQKIPYSGTRYPEINKKVERFINSSEALLNPPDYSDILKIVQRANERYNLQLSRKQQAQISQEAFRETGNKLQERRHLDMVYNFGSHLTDPYKPTLDPALMDPALHRKLRSNRDVAISSLEEVINKYANKQEDMEVEETKKRQDRERLKKEAVNGQQSESKEKEKEEQEEKEKEDEEEEEEDEEEDDSSDPDIEDEIQASEQQAGPEDDEEDVEEEPANISDNDQPINESSPLSIKSSVQDTEEDEEQSPLSSTHEGSAETNTNTNGPAKQSLESTEIKPESIKPESIKPESIKPETIKPESIKPENTDSLAEVKTEQVSSNHVEAVSASTETVSIVSEESSTAVTRSANCSPLLPTSPLLIDETGNYRKRKRRSTENHTSAHNGNCTEDSDIPLDMGVICCSEQEDLTCLKTPPRKTARNSQATPPPKKNKVNVATQCDPEEVIVLSDSE